MNVLHTRWRALVLALLLAVSLAVPAAAAETEAAAADLQTQRTQLPPTPPSTAAPRACNMPCGRMGRSFSPARPAPSPGPKTA